MTDLGTVYREQYQALFVNYGSARFKIIYSSVSDLGVPTVLPQFYVVQDRAELIKRLNITIEDNETGIVFPALDMTNDSLVLVEPKIDDFFADLDGDSWIVNGVYPDNFAAQWLLKVQEYDRG